MNEDTLVLGLFGLLMLVVAVVVFLAFVTSAGAQEFRLQCVAQGGIPLLNTSDFGNVCVEKFIEIKQ